MKTTHYILSWLFFATSYVVLYGLVFTFFPELWLWGYVRKLYNGFIDEAIWNNIYMCIVLALALLLNISFMFILLSVVQHVKQSSTRKKKRSL